MRATRLLYLDDFGVMTADGKVTAVSQADDGRTDVQLDATCFYPRAGGQDWDIGAIIGRDGAIFAVEEVQLDGHGVVHHLGSHQFGRLKAGEAVQGIVNEGRRKINTWLHAAGHVIDMAVDRLGLPWVLAGAAHYPHRCFVEYQGTVQIGAIETIRQTIEQTANEIIAKGGPSSIRLLPMDELRGVCGTHVRDVSILKRIEITKLRAKKGLIKLSYSVGGDPPFRDRADAGRQLAEALAEYKHTDAVVYVLPRGGAAVGAEVARRLGVPIELVITRKIGHPANPEGAIGAVDEDGKVLWATPPHLKISQAWLDQAVQRQRLEVTRRLATYLGKRPRRPAAGKNAIIVDDGAATGLTIIAAIKKLLAEQPKQIIVALPVAHQQAIAVITKYANKTVVLYAKTPQDFAFVGTNYQTFNDLTDSEVLQAIAQFRSFSC